MKISSYLSSHFRHPDVQRTLDFHSGEALRLPREQQRGRSPHHRPFHLQRAEVPSLGCAVGRILADGPFPVEDHGIASSERLCLVNGRAGAVGGIAKGGGGRGCLSSIVYRPMRTNNVFCLLAGVFFNDLTPGSRYLVCALTVGGVPPPQRTYHQRSNARGGVPRDGVDRGKMTEK